MKIARIISVILALALIPSWGAGYATEEDPSRLNSFAWIDEFADLCDYIGFDAAWMYVPGGKEGNHYFTLYIKPVGEIQDYHFPMVFATDESPGTGSVRIFCNFNAEDTLDAKYVEQVVFLFFAMAQMTVATGKSEQMNIETLLLEGSGCIFRILYQSPDGYYVYESASGIRLKILGYEPSSQKIRIVLTMEYTGREN